jgi:Pentapeptide repeats (8 copies)
MKATKQIDEAIARVIRADASEFVKLVKIAGLNPSRDFRFTNLSGVNFSGSDLAGFDFTGASIEGASFVGARISGARFDDVVGGVDRLQEAVDWQKRRRGPVPNDGFSLFDDFLPYNYIENFAPFLWTHIAGYPSLIELFRFAERLPSTRNVKEHVEVQRLSAVNNIPDGWKMRFERGDWNKCSTSQIKDACIGNAMRFDKACIAMKALELAFVNAESARLRDLNIYDFLSLRPAVFVLSEMEDRARAFLYGQDLGSAEKSQRVALISRLSPRDGYDAELHRARAGERFLAEVAEGFGITFQNAAVIADFLFESGFAKPSVKALGDRTNRGRMKKEKRCNAFENAFVSPRAATLNVSREFRY